MYIIYILKKGLNNISPKYKKIYLIFILNEYIFYKKLYI